MKNRNKMKVFYRLFFVAAIFFAVFVLSQLGNEFVAVGIAGVVLLIAGYLYFSQIEKEKQEEREYKRMELDRKLDELLNAQRAIYTIIKRRNTKIEIEYAATHEDEQITEILVKIKSAQERALEENRKLAEIQVNALKTVAKYNKENTRQLALSISKNTDRLSERLQSSTVELHQDIKGTTEAIEEAEEFYQNVVDALEKGTNEVEPSAKEAAKTEQVGEAEPSAEEASKTEQVEEVEPSAKEAYKTEQVEEAEPSAEEVSELEAIAEADPLLDIASEPEPVLEPNRKEPSLSMPVEDNLNVKANPDVADLFASVGTGTKGGSDIETLPEPEPIAEPKPSMDTASELGQISIPIPDPEQILIPEPEPIQAPPLMSVMDDPNKKMSSDDIAALIGSLTPQE